MSSPEIENIMEPYIKQMGLMWKVVSEFGETDRPQVVSVKQAHEHRILMPNDYRGKLGKYRCDVVHELVHGKFAESLDPIFSGVYFDRGYDERKPEIQVQMYRTYYAQQLVDVWVADRMRKLDRILNIEDIDTSMTGFLTLPDEFYIRNPLEILLGYALNQAEITRGGFKGYDKRQKKVLHRVERVLGGEDAKTAERLAHLYSTLPELPDNREEALSLFEKSTQKAAEILGLPIQPKIVKSEEDNVWRFD